MHIEYFSNNKLEKEPKIILYMNIVKYTEEDTRNNHTYTQKKRRRRRGRRGEKKLTQIIHKI